MAGRGGGEATAAAESCLPRLAGGVLTAWPGLFNAFAARLPAVSLQPVDRSTSAGIALVGTPPPYPHAGNARRQVVRKVSQRDREQESDGDSPPGFACPTVLLMPDVTRILEAIGQGDPQAAAQLLPLVYDELRQLAAQRLAREKPGQTLDATALVHEAYLRLVGRPERQRQWDSRGHFFAAAAEAMRRILVENARRKKRLKHGGGRQRVDLVDQPAPTTDEDLLALDEALGQLAAEDAVAARVVELRHFAGLGHEQTAGALGITVYQARQKWAYARAWLRDGAEAAD